MSWMPLVQSTLILFAIVNPVGSIPIFLQLTGGMSRKVRTKTFDTGILTSVVILFIFTVAGEGILTHYFQISISDLMAAGGLLLLIIAIDHLVFGALVKGVLSDQKKDEHQIGAVPIACPILAGPGAMMTVIVTYSKYGFAVAGASIIIVFTLTWVIMRFIDRIYAFLGKIVCLVLSKILSLFLAAIGIHLLMEGLSYYFK